MLLLLRFGYEAELSAKILLEFTYEMLIIGINSMLAIFPSLLHIDWLSCSLFCTQPCCHHASNPIPVTGYNQFSKKEAVSDIGQS